MARLYPFPTQRRRRAIVFTRRGRMILAACVLAGVFAGLGLPVLIRLIVLALGGAK